MYTLQRIEIILIFLVIMATSCQNDFDKKNKEPNIQPSKTPTPEMIPVETNIVKTGYISKHYETTATIETESRIVIYPKISEQVKMIYVEEGDQVQTGQLLATLDNEKLLLQVQQARVARDQTKDAFERTKQLYESQMTSKENYLNAKYAYENSEVALKMAQLDLSYSSIRSPIDGIITNRFVSIGDLVTLSSQLFVIVDPKALIVEIHLPEKESHLVSVGMSATLYPDALPNRAFPAVVLRIQPFVDAKTGTVKMTLKILSGYDLLAIGMFTRVRIKLAEHSNVIIIPKNALLRENGDRFVFIMTPEGQAEKRRVSIGIEDDDKIEILSGLRVGERLVVVGQQNIEPGQYIYDSNMSMPNNHKSIPDEEPTTSSKSFHRNDSTE